MLSKYEELLAEAEREQISVDEDFPFESDLKGLYIDRNIALSDQLRTSAEKACVLAEELGHHYTTVGNILDGSDLSNAKQEHQARAWGCSRLVGLPGLVDAYEHHCRNYYEAAEYLEVTEAQIKDTIALLRTKYGERTRYRDYEIRFEPYLEIEKR